MTTVRSEPTAELPWPEPDGLLPDGPEWDETGLLPADKVFTPLPFMVPEWDYQAVPGGTTTLQVFWDDQSFERRQWDESVPGLTPADLQFDVPADRLTPGIHQLWYTVLNPLGNEQGSLKRVVTVDLTAPQLGANSGQLQFDTHEVTEKYLEDHGDRVEGLIAAYSGGKSGDQVVWYWNADPFDISPTDVVGTRTLSRQDLGKPLTLPFDGDMIRARGDGDRYAFYRVKDRAGNSTPESRPSPLKVDTASVPRVLPPASVKEAPGTSGNATLNPSNALNGVTVVIPATAVIDDDETVAVQWAEPGTAGAFRATNPVTPGSREYKIPSTCIAAHFGKILPVYYEVTEPGVIEPHTSQNLSLRVSDMAGGWPAAQSDSVDGGQLSLARVTDAARFTLKSWQFMATDQFITVQVLGVDHAGSSRMVPVLTEEPVPQVAPIINVGQISRSDLQGFKLDERIEVRVSISFDGKQAWKIFPSLTPMLVA